MPNVLLIEDNDLNQDLIARYLELFDCSVTVVTDGQVGLHAAQQDPSQFDVVLLDMNLPTLDGWEVTRRLKADAATRDLPVVALTAHAMRGDREKALEAGCDDYETKPIDFNSLFDKINSLIAKVPC
jgi:two-component system, cell cycle response regulator DivK